MTGACSAWRGALRMARTWWRRAVTTRPSGCGGCRRSSNRRASPRRHRWPRPSPTCARSKPRQPGLCRTLRPWLRGRHSARQSSWRRSRAMAARDRLQLPSHRRRCAQRSERQGRRARSARARRQCMAQRAKRRRGSRCCRSCLSWSSHRTSRLCSATCRCATAAGAEPPLEPAHEPHIGIGCGCVPRRMPCERPPSGFVGNRLRTALRGAGAAAQELGTMLGLWCGSAAEKLQASVRSGTRRARFRVEHDKRGSMRVEMHLAPAHASHRHMPRTGTCHVLPYAADGVEEASAVQHARCLAAPRR